MSATIAAARKLITERLRAIEAEANQLQRALTSMGERDGSAPATPKPPRKRGPRKRRRPQAPPGQRREQLLAAIGAKPGARPKGGLSGVIPLSLELSLRNRESRRS